MSTKTILVFGATGQQGSALIKALGDKGGYEILAVSRDPTSEASKALAAQPGVTVVKGEVGNHDQLFDEKSIYGLFFFNKSFDLEQDVKNCKSLIDLAVEKGVHHIVLPLGTFAVIEKPVPAIHSDLDNKIGIENLVRAAQSSGKVKTTILRPVAFYENFTALPPYKNQVTNTWFADNNYKFIATSDIGRIAAEVFANPDQWAGKEVNIAGDSLKPADVVKIWKEVTGQSLEGLEPPQFPSFLESAMLFFNKNEFEADIEWNKAQFPWLTDFRTWLTANKSRLL